MERSMADFVKFLAPLLINESLGARLWLQSILRFAWISSFPPKILSVKSFCIPWENQCP